VVAVGVPPAEAVAEVVAVAGSFENDTDLIVLDRNLFEISASEISDAAITATIFDGRTVRQKEDK